MGVVCVRRRAISPCQAPGVWPLPLPSLISGSCGWVIHHCCQKKKKIRKRKKKNAIGLVCWSPTAYKRARETALACVLCESAVVRLLMLTCSHVSVICDSDSKLEAGKQRQTQLSRGGHHYEMQYETILLYTVNIANSKTNIFFPSWSGEKNTKLYSDIWRNCCPSFSLSTYPSELIISDESVALGVLAIVHIATLGEYP